MDLRPELLPPPVSRERLDEFPREIERVVELVELGPSEDADYYELLLQSNVAWPGAAGLALCPPAELRDASPERIVEEILRYRPIAL
ncbi:hypothetical protein [Streptomyces wuyuanensis]|uniref:hypothetical protein n=1 Tax=Streptomyces wuyuanensis TaxID=1196353 RepID=UPI003721B58C